MIPEEEEYLKLVGAVGHSFAKRSWELLTAKLYYLTLTNAYYRGLNAGVDKARDVITAAKVGQSGKPTN